MMGAIIRTEGMSFNEFKTAFDRSSTSLPSEANLSCLRDAILNQSNYTGQLQQVLDLTTKQLSPDAMRILALVSCYDPDGIPVKMLEMGTKLSKRTY
jgi:hypothetical protein